MLVNPNIGAQVRPSYHTVLILQEKIEKLIIGATCSRRLALLIREEQLGLLENLVLKVLEQRFQHNVTYHEVNTCNQSIKCNKHVLYESIERKRK
jgi:hypothetical protein